MTHVITAILTKDGEILILKRGHRVSTYRGRWAGVSGYLEENETPLQRAMKEIEEETGLKNNEIKLIREGEVMEFIDENNGRIWRVHPFLFEVKRKKIKIDWEHEEYRWIDVEDIDKYETVPGLKKVILTLLNL